MHYLVIDLEWNIPRRDEMKKLAQQVSFSMEIIEIGAVLLNARLEILGEFAVDVKPQYFKILDKHVKEITNRADESLKSGELFPEAVAQLYEWIHEKTDDEYLFCTWSKSDIKPWRSNLEHYGLLPNPSSKILDIQRLFQYVNEDFKEQKSISFALDYFKLPPGEDLHKAINDARYTAYIFQKVVENLQSKDLLPKHRAKLGARLEKLSFDPSINRKRTIKFNDFESKELAYRFLLRHTYPCPACGMDLEKISKWRSKKALRYLAKYSCKVHGYVNIQANIHRYSIEEELKWQISARLNLEHPM